jgi:hypothetical protein
LGAVQSEPQTGHQLSWLRFYMAFLSPSRCVSRQYLEIGHDCLLSNSLLIITYSSNAIQYYWQYIKQTINQLLSSSATKVPLYHMTLCSLSCYVSNSYQMELIKTVTDWTCSIHL